MMLISYDFYIKNLTVRFTIPVISVIYIKYILYLRILLPLQKRIQECQELVRGG